MFLEGRPLRDNALDERYYLARGRIHSRLQRAVDSHFNTLLLGERGSGKSTELAQLARHLRLQSRPVALVDASLAETPIAVIELIRVELGRATTVTELWRRAFRAAFVPPPGLSVDAQLLEAVRSLAPEDLDDDARDPERICLILDGLTSIDLARALFGRLRDELWRLPYTWVLAGDVAHEASLLAPPADAFFDAIVRIPHLTLEDSQRLVELRGDGSTPVDVNGFVGGWADTPREVLQMFREALLEDRTPSEVQAEQRQLDDRAQAMGSAIADAYRTIRSIGRPISASDEELQAVLGWSRPRIAKVLKELEAAGLVRASTAAPDGTGGRPRVLYLPVTEVFR